LNQVFKKDSLLKLLFHIRCIIIENKLLEFKKHYNNIHEPCQSRKVSELVKVFSRGSRGKKEKKEKKERIRPTHI
jgi:hypothetical protein